MAVHSLFLLPVACSLFLPLSCAKPPALPHAAHHEERRPYRPGSSAPRRPGVVSPDDDERMLAAALVVVGQVCSGEPAEGAMVQRKPRTKKTPAERNRELEREAAAQGVKPLSAETLASLALGTPQEAGDLLEVSAEVRLRGRTRRRSS